MVKRRKSTVMPPPSVCPLRECIKLLSGAWTPEVIWYLRGGERCFTELQADLRGVSAKVLTGQLRKLVREGALERIPRQTSPPTVWYRLSPLGQELLGALSIVVDVGQRLKLKRQVQPAASASAATALGVQPSTAAPQNTAAAQHTVLHGRKTNRTQ